MTDNIFCPTQSIEKPEEFGHQFMCCFLFNKTYINISTTKLQIIYYSSYTFQTHLLLCPTLLGTLHLVQKQLCFPVLASWKWINYFKCCAVHRSLAAQLMCSCGTFVGTFCPVLYLPWHVPPFLFRFRVTHHVTLHNQSLLLPPQSASWLVQSMHAVEGTCDRAASLCLCAVFKNTVFRLGALGSSREEPL
jgi:hypothetical protein